MSEELESKLRNFLNLYWLRPENGLINPFKSLAFENLKIESPSLDLSCGDGMFMAIHLGATFDTDFDYFKSTKASEFSHSSSEISIPFMPDKRFSEVKKIEKKLREKYLNNISDVKTSDIISEDLSNIQETKNIPSGSIEIGFFLILLSILVISGSSNAINLTDGIDGLATGLSGIVFFSLGLIAYASGHINFSSYLNITYISGAGELAVFCMAMVGACLGFLWYNSHPAEIFMGDTGSLALGAAMGTLAIILKKEILLIIIAGVFVIEALSVIMQISFFKYTRMRYGKSKRLFLMAPLHHHYELKGMKESKIVVRFWIVGILLALLALITLKVQ